MAVRVLLISGSLRAESGCSAVLRTAAAASSPDIEPVLYEDLGALPHFNPDDDGGRLHPAVGALRDAIHAADALLFSAPEYAGALPGSFKNLLDWTIGDDQPRSIYEKPVAWINASPRPAIGAQEELRTVLGYAHAHIVEAACVHIPILKEMVGADGLIADIASVAAITRAVADLVRGPSRPLRPGDATAG